MRSNLSRILSSALCLRIASRGCEKTSLSKEVHLHPLRRYLHAQLTGYGLQLLHIIDVRDSISHVVAADIELGKEAPIIREAAISRH